MAESAPTITFGGTAISANQPAIVVIVNDSINPLDVTEIGLGIEEESVPFRSSTDAEDDPMRLAHRAALESRLGVGIGIGRERAVITTDKLPEDRPYLVIPLGESQDRDRAIGSNSARIVKRQPLVGYPPSNSEGPK